MPARSVGMPLLPGTQGDRFPAGRYNTAMEPGFAILYEDDQCLVVSKPAGVLTQAPPGIDSMEVRIKTFLAERDGRNGPCYLGMPHRLDRPATGALLVGKDRKSTRRLAEQFEGRLIEKTYWIAVAGAPSPAEGTWTDYLRKIPDEPRAEVVAEGHPEGRIALLHYRVLRQVESVALLEIRLETGRTHQIRVQASSRGLPVLGDAMYGSTLVFGPQHADERERAIALHAREISFRQPKTSDRLVITAPLDAAWDAIGFSVPSSAPAQSPYGA